MNVELREWTNGQDTKHKMKTVAEVVPINQKSPSHVTDMYVNMEEPQSLVDALACKVGQEHVVGQVSEN